MRAILVAAVEDDKIYYDLDAKNEQKDAILVRPDGSMVKVDFFDFANSCGGLLKIRTSKFHKFMWDGAAGKKANLWKSVFIDKTKDVSESVLENVDVFESLGKNRKKMLKTDKKAKAFKKTVDKKSKQKVQTKSAQPCCDNEMVKFDMKNLVFGDAQTRKQAWTAMILLRQLESN
jgi:hypothetical protein